MGIIIAQFVTANDPESNAIRWASDGLFSHVDIVLPDGLLGAHSDGVKLRPPNYNKWTLTQQVYVEVPDADKAIAFARAQIGKPYNFDAILDMVLHRTRPFIAVDQSKWFCDELVYAAVEQGGVQLLNIANPIGLTPWEVYLSPLWKK